MNLRDIQRLALLICFVGLTAGNTRAQEPIPTPSEKMQEAVGKLNKAPATIGQSLQGLRDAAAAKLKQTLGAGAKPDAKAAPVDLDVHRRASYRLSLYLGSSAVIFNNHVRRTRDGTGDDTQSKYGGTEDDAEIQ